VSNMVIRADAVAAAVKTYRRADFRPAAFTVRKLVLSIEIQADQQCEIRTRLEVERALGAPADAPLQLDGEKLALRSLRVNGDEPSPDTYVADTSGLRIEGLAQLAIIETVHSISLAREHGYMGLYAQGDVVLADTEPEGFRHIAYCLDRPDVKAPYEVTLIADAGRYPTLLSNGQRIGSGRLSHGRHFVTWHDPLPKGPHVFTLVAGNLAQLTDEFVTASGRHVEIAIYAAADEIEQCRDGLRVLKRAMRWDEEHFGREYDGDLFNIVVIPDYNQGGMEYRGLNIFSSANLRPPGALEDELKIRGDSVIGHEYFHNWLGVRVSVRDWFNLTLKEGLVVFKTQEFSADLVDPALQRVLDVRFLREYQFPEDDSVTPQAPRPDNYTAVQNLYTKTTYEKSAEIARMLRLIVGPEAFRKGLDLFHARHDLQAAQIEDLLRAMTDASGRDLRQFGRWYTQPGRPALQIVESYDAAAKTYLLDITQVYNSAPGTTRNKPFYVPVTIALLDDGGVELPLQLAQEPRPGATSRTFAIDGEKAQLQFLNVASRPTASVLRNFSAPVSVRMKRSHADLARLMTRDHDAFCRWDAGQQLASRLILDAAAGNSNARHRVLYRDAISALCAERSKLAGLIIRRPAEATIAPEGQSIDVDGIHKARLNLEREVASALADQLADVYCGLVTERDAEFTAALVARRILKNECLLLLCMTAAPGAIDWCRQQIASANNLTDRIGALRAMLAVGSPAAEQALDDFYSQWRSDGPALEGWYALQASVEREGTALRLRRLVEQGAIRLDSATALRSMFDTFARNQIGFHEASGEGYRLVADIALRLNELNPRMAARFALGFKTLRRFDSHRQQLMREQLARIMDARNVAPELQEVASSCLE
jgi:aminopeptidase N